MIVAPKPNSKTKVDGRLHKLEPHTKLVKGCDIPMQKACVRDRSGPVSPTADPSASTGDGASVPLGPFFPLTVPALVHAGIFFLQVLKAETEGRSRSLYNDFCHLLSFYACSTRRDSKTELHDLPKRYGIASSLAHACPPFAASASTSRLRVCLPRQKGSQLVQFVQSP